MSQRNSTVRQSAHLIEYKREKQNISSQQAVPNLFNGDEQFIMDTSSIQKTYSNIQNKPLEDSSANTSEIVTDNTSKFNTVYDGLLASSYSNHSHDEEILSRNLEPIHIETVNRQSSLLNESLIEILREDIHTNGEEPTSALLAYCKQKFLLPYIKITAIVGINPTTTTDSPTFTKCCSHIQVIIIVLFLFLGYIFQYICSYRVDRCVKYQINPDKPLNNSSECGSCTYAINELIFAYITPSALHFFGYISAVIVVKVIEHEELLNLIERVFLMSIKPNRLCDILWYYFATGFIFILLRTACLILSILSDNNIERQCLLPTFFTRFETADKIILLLSLLFQNLIEIIVMCTYCINCYLIKTHLETLSYKLLMNTIHVLDWMREFLELHKLLNHLNNRVSIPVSFLIVLHFSYSISSVIYLFRNLEFLNIALKFFILNVFNVLLLLIMGLLPFFFAASLTRTCQRAKANGHQIRVRPFVYSNTSVDELDSTLLFASSLEMSAKLFRMPIQPNYLCFAILLVSIVIISTGMSFNIKPFGDF